MDEKTAHDPIQAQSNLTLQVLETNGFHVWKFTKAAIAVLNQAVRPFTASWHRMSLADAFDEATQLATIRAELISLQKLRRNYTKTLAELAAVVDLTHLETT